MDAAFVRMIEDIIETLDHEQRKIQTTGTDPLEPARSSARSHPGKTEKGS